MIPGLSGRRGTPGFEVPFDLRGGLLLPGSGDDGVCLGTGRDGQPVHLQVFTEDVGRIGALLPIPDVLDLLAGVLAGGARVVVASARPAVWQAVAAALGEPSRLAVLAPNAAVPGDASFAHPLLLVRDTHLVTPPNRLPPGPWRSVLTLVPDLGPGTAPALRTSHAFLIRRLAAAETDVAARLLGLPAPAVDVLAAVPDGQFAVLADDELHLVTADGGQAASARRHVVARALAPPPSGAPVPGTPPVGIRSPIPQPGRGPRG